MTKPQDSEPGPWDFPPGSMASRSAAIRLLEKRKNEFVNVHIFHVGGGQEEALQREREQCGPNDIFVQIIHVGE